MTTPDAAHTPEVLVLEHTAAAGASAFEEVLDARTSIAPWRRVDVPAGEALPSDPAMLAGLVVMGGTMSAVDPAAHPWMPAELALLRRAVDAEVPVLGVCLGAQLLGAALGGAVTRRAVPQVGYLGLTRTEAGRQDPVVGGWPDGAAVLFLHEDEVSTLPPAALPLLEGGDGVPGWRVGSALAVQCHPEVTGEQLGSWLGRELLTDLLERAEVDTAALGAEAARRSTFTVPLGRALIGRFLDGPVRARVAA